MVDETVVIDEKWVAGHMVHFAVAIAVAVVMGVEHSPGLVVEVEREACSVVVLRWWSSLSNSMASSQSPGLAFVLAARPQPARVGKTADVGDVIRRANRKPGYQAPEVGIGSIVSHTLSEDGA